MIFRKYFYSIWCLDHALGEQLNELPSWTAGAVFHLFFPQLIYRGSLAVSCILRRPHASWAAVCSYSKGAPLFLLIPVDLEQTGTLAATSVFLCCRGGGLSLRKCNATSKIPPWWQVVELGGKRPFLPVPLVLLCGRRDVSAVRLVSRSLGSQLCWCVIGSCNPAVKQCCCSQGMSKKCCTPTENPWRLLEEQRSQRSHRQNTNLPNCCLSFVLIFFSAAGSAAALWAFFSFLGFFTEPENVEHPK